MLVDAKGQTERQRGTERKRGREETYLETLSGLVKHGDHLVPRVYRLLTLERPWFRARQL